jgi:hypothetical protein
MSEPEKKPAPEKLEGGLKGINLETFGESTQKLLKDLAGRPDPLAEKAESALKKGASFFKKAKAALKGDETAKEELADAAAQTVIKTGEALEKAGKAAGDMIDRTDKKITEAREKKARPPAP